LQAAQSNERKSVALTRKGAERLFATFDKRPFKPQESKNGTGRKKNTVLPKKQKHPPQRKNKNEQNYKQNIEQII
jgi:DNA-binding PadR family transcriptional regulator